MQKDIIEILKTQGNLFDFQIIGILIAFYGYGDSAKEFIRHPTSNKLQFEMIFRKKLEDIGIKITYEKYYLCNSYEYFYRFYLVQEDQI